MDVPPDYFRVISTTGTTCTSGNNDPAAHGRLGPGDGMRGAYRPEIGAPRRAECEPARARGRARLETRHRTGYGRAAISSRDGLRTPV